MNLTSASYAKKEVQDVWEGMVFKPWFFQSEGTRTDCDHGMD
jgi:hypothetical protein